MVTPPPVPDVDALREKLRALGYLDAGVDRFVLGSAHAGQGLRALAILASLRIGVLTGLLGGISGTIATAVRLPGLMTGPRDAVIVALALGVLFGGAAAVVALGAILVVGRFARAGRTGEWVAGRARRVSVTAGAASGLLCLAYLTLWWRATGQAGAIGGITATVLALSVAGAISLVLGYTITATARAVLAAGSDAATPVHPARLSWRWSLGLALLGVLAGGALLAVTTGSDDPNAAQVVPLTVVPTGWRLTVIAIDGFDPAFAASADRSAGRGNRFATVLASPGAWIGADASGDPVRRWTTIATGQPPDRHGVSALEVRSVTGLGGRVAAESRVGHVLAAATDLLRLTRPVVTTGVERRERTFWEVAAAAGLRTATVNWWTTFPVGEYDGTVLSDRAALRLERGGPLAGEIGPPAVYEPLRRAWPSIKADARDRSSQLLQGLPPDLARALLRPATLDVEQALLAVSPLLGDSDLLTVYLPGLDIAQVALLGPGRGRASELAGQVEALRRYYELIAQLVATISDARTNDVLVLVTQPGRGVQDVRGRFHVVVGGGSGSDGGTTPAAVMRAEDVAPTLLYALGVPVSGELGGRPRLDMFPRGFTERWPVRHVPTYGRRGRTVRAAVPDLDEEMRERLRSLGYVQ